MRPTDLPSTSSEVGDLPEVDDRLERYIAGTLPPVDVAAFVAEAEDDPLLAAALEAAAPLSTELMERAANAAVRQFHASRQGAWWAAKRWAGPVLAVAAAALISVMLWPRGPELPTYEAPRLVRASTVRSAHPVDLPRQALQPGDPLNVRMAAFTQPESTPRLLVYVDAWTPRGRVDAPRATISEEGSIELRGTVGEGPWSLASGEHRLLLAVGPSWAWAPWWGEPGSHWQRFEVPILVH